MKTKILLLICGIVLSMSAISQNSMEYTEINSENVLSTIIREVSYPTKIICHNTDEENVKFVYIDAALNTIEFYLKYNELVVQDMVVLSKDTVVFCGTAVVNGGNRGIVGFFTISDVLSGTVNIFTQNYFISGTASLIVTTFKRMVSYYNSYGDRRIVCIGKCIDINGTDLYPCIAYITGLDFMTGGYICGHITNTNETFEDVDLVTVFPTDKGYIVTAGFDNTNGLYMGFRIYDADNLFPLTSNLQDTLRLLRVDPSSTRKWLDEGLALSHITRGEFATASYRHNNLNSNFLDANLHIGSYSVDGILRGSFSIMNNSLEVPMLNTGNRTVKDFIYSPRKHQLVFLHDFTSLSSGIAESRYCELDESSLPNVTSFYFFGKTDLEIDRLDLFNNNIQYIWCGFQRPTPYFTENGMDTYGYFYPCLPFGSYAPTHYSPLSIVKIRREFNSNGGIIIRSSERKEVQAYSVDRICTKP